MPLIHLHFVQVKLWSHFKPPSRVLPSHYTPGALIGQTDSGRPITGDFTYRSSSLLYFKSRQFKQHLLQIYSWLCLNNDLRQNSDKILVKLHTYLLKNDTWTFRMTFRMWSPFLIMNKSQDVQTLKNILALLRIYMVIPSSTAEAKRGFSLMQRIKNDHRSRLSGSTLTDLMMVKLSAPDLDSFDPVSSISM